MLNKVMIKFKEEQLGYEEKMDLLTEGICKYFFSSRETYIFTYPNYFYYQYKR